MRVVIQVESGMKAGHRFSLRPGEQLQFGRTEWADAVFNSDRHMSGVHFKIQAEQNACYLEDLNSSHGTIVNDQPVTRVVLRSGDRIKAGETLFCVDLEGDSPDSAGDVAANAPVAQRASGGAPATYSVGLCKSTLNCYQGRIVEIPPARLAKLFNKTYQTTLIVDPAKLPPAASETLGGAEYLFDWLPEEIRQLNSPILLFEEQQLGNLSTVHHTWGHDTLVAVYSEKDEPVPLEQLRRCAGVFARPSVLRPQLSETAVEQAHDFMLGVDAVLVEDESPESWLLYSTSDLGPLLEEFGLQEAMRDSPPSTDSESVSE